MTNTVIRHPSVIVNSVSSLDNLVPGRTILGIGGGGPSLLMPLGFKVGRASEFKEDLRSIMTLTNGGQVTLSEEAQYGVNSALHPIPVYVAASGPIMLGLTGELADGVVITGAAQKDTFAQKINLAREGAAKSGKDTNKLKINLMITVAVDSNRDKANANLNKMLVSNNIDMVVLARYMQIIPDDVVDRFDGKMINIHHGFLPAFKGNHPYSQAWKRGVKIIGATAHYVTNELDEGPIITQDVVPVSHHHSVSEMIESGRNLERNVLVDAIKAHLEYRIILHGQRTIIFNK